MGDVVTPECSARLTLHLVGSSSWSEVPAVFSYASDDPFAVHVRFGAVGRGDVPVETDALASDGAGSEPLDEAPDPDEGVEWLLSRDLLQAGLAAPAGEGDVRLWPARPPADVLYLELRAPSGQALFELSRAGVAAFLRRTTLLVPFGTEGAHVCVDDELAALLSGGWADPNAR
jgi:hypothetical protein